MEVRRVECKTAASPSRLPGLDWAVNPYRGCAHGCLYCYAQDVTRFETSRPWGEVVEAKFNIVSVIKKELSKGTRGVYGVGTVTDPYQPVESEFELTRGCLVMLKRHGASVSVLTKSDLVLRDLDLLAGWKAVEVGVSLGSASDEVAGLLEPGASLPSQRIRALKGLVEAGVEAYVMAAPIVKDLSDSSDALEGLVAAVRDAGVTRIMWDKLNRKPLAHARLARSFEGRSGHAPRYHSEQDMAHLRNALKDACARYGLALTEAF